MSRLHCPQINELEKAVELLGEALQSHISAFGGAASSPSCACCPRLTHTPEVSDATCCNCSSYCGEYEVLKSWLLAELGEECAAVYHRYGAALFYKAQEDSDVFGAPLRQAALAQEPEPAAANAAGSADGQPAPAGTPSNSLDG